MEKTGFVINGGVKLPVGYRFCPTDEELVEHYLKRKVFAMPLPASVIPEFDVFLADPWGLPGDLKEKRFFFSKQKNFLKKTAGSGVWKSIGRDKLIFNSGINQVFGLRKSLVFSEAKFSERTNMKRWVMHEYRLACSATTPNSTQSGKIELGDWAIYCLFQKRRRPKRHAVVSQAQAEENQRLGVTEASVLDLTLGVEDGYEFPQARSSSCSSGVTEVSCNGTESTDQEESSGVHITFPSYSQSHMSEM